MIQLGGVSICDSVKCGVWLALLWWRFRCCFSEQGVRCSSGLGLEWRFVIVWWWVLEGGGDFGECGA